MRLTSDSAAVMSLGGAAGEGAFVRAENGFIQGADEADLGIIDGAVVAVFRKSLANVAHDIPNSRAGADPAGEAGTTEAGGLGQGTDVFRKALDTLPGLARAGADATAEGARGLVPSGFCEASFLDARFDVGAAAAFGDEGDGLGIAGDLTAIIPSGLVSGTVDAAGELGTPHDADESLVIAGLDGMPVGARELLVRFFDHLEDSPLVPDCGEKTLDVLLDADAEFVGAAILHPDGSGGGTELDTESAGLLFEHGFDGAGDALRVFLERGDEGIGSFQSELDADHDSEAGTQVSGQ